CAGHSGGGTLTTFISVADDRIRCAANIEGGITNRWPMRIAPWEPLGPSDIEQNLFPAALYGVDGVDLSSAIAPRPLLAAVEHYSPDFDRCAQAIHARYQELGFPEKFTTISSDDPHAWTVKLRLATTDWFCRWFYNRSGPAVEPQFELEPPESLYCMPDGSVRYSQEGQTIFSLIIKKQAKLPPERPIPRTSAQLKANFTETRNKIRQLLHYEKSNQPLNVRSVVTTHRKGYRIEKIQFLSAPGIYIPAWAFVPERKTRDSAIILYVSDEGIETDGMEFEGSEESGLSAGLLDTLARKGNLAIAVDVRGIGETRPLHRSGSSASGVFGQLFDVETALSYMAWFMDQSLLGMRVEDVLRSIDYVMSRADVDNKPLHVIGRGRGGLWCLYAALLDTRIRSLICVRSLLSYRSLAEVDRYVYGADVFIPDVLLQLDLPQVAGAMAGRPLALVLPTDALKNVVEVGVARETYRWALGAYESAGSGNLFRIESKGTGLETPEHYLDLIRAFQSGWFRVAQGTQLPLLSTL
ncbi:MAG TPA: alpha/beta fold hydrolase, partial [Terriglobia bacterium]|nr:alpha/beta fold hydrolase [Terriglobia bacterium]